jgi:RHS repeat-associated protein
LGTPQGLVRKNGAKVWEGEYWAFGGVKSETGDWENLLRFPGQYFDEETGNYYNYYRDYDPSSGRYLQSDPIGLFGGLNTFTFSLNNTIVNYDEDALSAKKKAAEIILWLAATLGSDQGPDHTIKPPRVRPPIEQEQQRKPLPELGKGKGKG